MKFTTVLGSLAIYALEVSVINASPIADGNNAAALEKREKQYCCVRFTNAQNDMSQYVEWDSGVLFHDFDIYGCPVRAYQGSTRPSDGGCSKWQYQFLGECKNLSRPYKLEPTTADFC